MGSDCAATVGRISEADVTRDPGPHPAGSAEPPADQTHAWRWRDQRIGGGFLFAVVALVGFTLWYAIDSRESAPVAAGTTATTPAVAATGPEAVTPARIRVIATQIGHPIYWVGPRADTTYELTVAAGGQTYLRYLPRGVAIGATQSYLTIATYPVPNAYAVTSALVGSVNTGITIPGNGIGEYPKGKPNDIHVAFQGGNVQIEVFDPSPTVAPKLVSSGAVVPV